MHRILPPVLAAVVLATAGCAAGESRVGPAASPTPSPSPSTVACPAEGSLFAASHAVTELPSGVTGVRLCDLSGATGPVAAPRELLTHDVGRLVDQFNAADRFDAEKVACTQEAGPAYAMVFAYPDRDPVTVTSMMAGCREVGGKNGGRELLASFVGLLEAQREATPPPALDASDVCAGPRQSWMPIRLDGLVGLSRCTDGPGDTATTTGSTTPDQWETLQADLVANARPTEQPPTPGPEETFVGINGYGEPLSLLRSGDSVVIWDAEPGLRDGRTLVWTPSPQSRAILDALG